jgi:lysophospholipase L1-like esterase
MALKFAVLGDSIGYGMGASRPADTVGARLVVTLADGGTAAELCVLAVSGACSDALDQQVRQAVGWGVEVALIVIGANDLTHFVPPEVAAGQLGAAVRALRRGGVQVVVCPAPDLSAVPWVPPEMRAMVRSASAAMRAAQTTAATAAGARVVDAVAAMSATFADDTSLFSADRFHPSSAGYAVLAAALAPVVSAAAADVRGPVERDRLEAGS